ncbi:MAG: hypothetical protein MJ106_03180, partial [Lentisphaeria bacterium]|nr:hypothetical protein [Lentisphaeria bacterium]
MKTYDLQYFEPSPESHPITRPEVLEKEDGSFELFNGFKNPEPGWEQWALPQGCVLRICTRSCRPY